MVGGKKCFLQKIIFIRLDTKIRLFLILGFIVGITTSCNLKGPYVSDYITIPDSLIGKIIADTVFLEPVINDLKVNLVFDEKNSIKVFPELSGPVYKVNVQPGQYVQKGEILAVQKSSQNMQLRRKLFRAQNNYSISEKNYLAAEEMYNKGYYSRAMLKAAELQQKRMETELQQIKSAYRSTISQDDKVEWIDIKAPVSGYITQQNADAGIAFNSQDSQSIFTISGNKNILFSADADKETLGSFSPDCLIHFKSELWPGKEFKASVKIKTNEGSNHRVLIYPQDPEFFSAYKLPESFTLSYYIPGKKELAVPLQAVIFINTKPFVFRYTDNNKVKKSEITMAGKSGTKIYVKCGLKNGDKVLSEGNKFLINSR